MALRIARSKREVFIREDFADLGTYAQVGRCLKSLVAKNTLIRIGQGLYAKAILGPITNEPIPRRGFDTIAREALNRLGVETVPSSYERLYNSGKTTQVPTGRFIGVKGRVARKIGYAGTFVTFERVCMSS